MIVSSPSGSTGTEHQRGTVLVVEDEVLIRLCVADTLRSSGYDVLEAASADEAKVLLATSAEIDFIFTDIQMPGSMDGAELARFVRANYPALGVMLTSGGGVPADDPGESVAFVAKPYHPEDVVKRVKDRLG